MKISFASLQSFIHRLRRAWAKPADFSVYRGYIDSASIENNQLVVTGWMLHQRGPYDDVCLYMNGERFSPAERPSRPDVGAVLNRIPQSGESGFRFQIPAPATVPGCAILLRVVGSVSGKECGEINLAFHPDMAQRLPAPPPHLMQRVDELTDPAFYLLKGAQNYAEFTRLIETHRPLSQINALLDWGCGSGRLASFFLEYASIPEIHGCDIDAEAIQWCQDHLAKGVFAVIPPFPPTQYPDDRFDLIIAFSVLTHLTRENQNVWLQEMRRLLRPGGLMLATVHSEAAARSILAPRDYQTYLRQGFYDGIEDNRLEGIAPQGYYRATFQTRDYSSRAWSDMFEIVEYAEQGASNYHDLILLRKH